MGRGKSQFQGKCGSATVKTPSPERSPFSAVFRFVESRRKLLGEFSQGEPRPESVGVRKESECFQKDTKHQVEESDCSLCGRGG